MKSCMSCSSRASDIILSVLSVNSDVPVRLNFPGCGKIAGFELWLSIEDEALLDLS